MGADMMMIQFLSWWGAKKRLRAPHGPFGRQLCQAEAIRMGFIDGDRVTEKGVRWVIDQIKDVRPLLRRAARSGDMTTAEVASWRLQA